MSLATIETSTKTTIHYTEGGMGNAWSVRMTPGCRQHVVSLGISQAEVQETMERPVARKSQDAERVWHIGGRLAVLVDANKTVLSVRTAGAPVRKSSPVQTRLNIHTNATKQAEALGVTEEEIRAAIESPERTAKAHSGREWRTRGNLTVLVANNGFVLSVKAAREERKSWSINILPKARQHAQESGIEERDIADVLTSPEVTTPGVKGCEWRTKGKLAVLVAPDGLVLSVRVGIEERESFNLAERPACGYADSGIKILAVARECAEKLEASAEDIENTLASPAKTAPGRNGAKWFMKGNLAVLRASDGLILSVMESLDAWIRGVEHHDKSLTISGGDGWTPPSSPKEMARLLMAHGFELEQNGSGHQTVTHPARSGVMTTLPTTPSDIMWSRAFVTKVRSKFGIELRP
ncbi:hypothetical protein ACWG8W_06280 [Citricoccus zhacaiensis]